LESNKSFFGQGASAKSPKKGAKPDSQRKSAASKEKKKNERDCRKTMDAHTAAEGGEKTKHRRGKRRPLPEKKKTKETARKKMNATVMAFRQEREERAKKTRNPR